MKNNNYMKIFVLFLLAVFVMNSLVCIPTGYADYSANTDCGLVACYDAWFNGDSLPSEWTLTENAEAKIENGAMHITETGGSQLALTRYFDDAVFLNSTEGRIALDVVLKINTDSGTRIRVKGNNPRGINLEFSLKNGKFSAKYRDADENKLTSDSVDYTVGQPFRFRVDFEAGGNKRMSVWAGQGEELELVVDNQYTYGGYTSMYLCEFAVGASCDFEILSYAVYNQDEPLSEEEVLQDAYDRLTFDYLSTNAPDDITSDLILPDEFVYGTKITWETSDDSVITSDGAITRQSGVDASATLTATIEMNNNTIQKEFEVGVVRSFDSDSDVVERLKSWLDMSRFTDEQPDSLTKDLNLPLEYNGALIEWTCVPDIVNDHGGLKRTLEDVSAVLTANITKGDISISKSFEITVLSDMYVDPMHMSDEEFFGLWDDENECWEIEGKIDYSYSSKLAPVEELAKSRDYSGAKKALLKYFQEKAPSMPQATTTSRSTVKYLAENIFFRDDVVGEQTVPLEYSEIIFDIPKSYIEDTDQLVFMLMGRKKDDGYIEFYSKEHGNNAPVLEVNVNGEMRRFPLVADSFIRPGDYADTNFGSSDIIEVKDSGAPVDDETRRGYLMFDTSSLKPSDVVSGGTVTLYGRSIAPHEKGVTMLYLGSSATWTEETLIWSDTLTGNFSWQGVNGGCTWDPPANCIAQWHLLQARMNHLLPLAAEYRITHDERFARAAISSMVDFINDKGNEPAPDQRYGKGLGGWPRTLDTGLRTYRVIPAYFSLISSKSMNEIASTAILKDCWRMANFLADEENFNPDSNWGGSQTYGLYYISSNFPEFRASNYQTDDAINSPWIPLATSRMEGMMFDIVYEDGSYEECSSSYTEGQYNTNKNFVELIMNDDNEISDEFEERFHKFTYYIFDLYAPSGEDVMWGDSAYRTRENNHLSDVIKWYDDPVLDYISSFGIRGTAPDRTSIKYDSSRTVFMRSGWNKNALFAFTNAKGGRGGHAHADDLHMTVGAYGRILLCDTGTYDYIYSHPMRLWIESTRGHNTIEINGKRQLNRGKFGIAGGTADDENARLGDIEEWITNESFDFVKISTPNNPGFKHTRNILFVRPDYWIVSDYITAEDQNAENTYRQFWHVPDDAEPELDIATKAFLTNYETGANMTVVPADSSDIEAAVLEGYYNPPNTAEYAEYTKTRKGNMTFDTVLYPSPDQKNHAVGVKRLELSDAAPESEATALKISIVDDSNQAVSTVAYYYMAQEDKFKAERSFENLRTDSMLSYVEYNTEKRLCNVNIKGGTYIEDTKNGRFIIKGVKDNDIGVIWEGNTLLVNSTTPEPDVSEMKIYSDVGVQRVLVNKKEVTFYQEDGIVHLDSSTGSSANDEGAGNSAPPSSGKKPGGSGGSSSSGGSVFVPPADNPPVNNEDGVSFDDVKDHWAKDDIEYLAGKKIINGYNGLFMPENKVTRAEFAAMVIRCLGLDFSDYSDSFKDVKSDDWFAPYVQTAYDKGLISGYGEGLFGPDDLITREQAAKIIGLACEKATEINLDAADLTFTDKDIISEWAYEGVGKAVAAGILKGDENGAFNPQSNASRAETAAMIRRLFSKLQ